MCIATRPSLSRALSISRASAASEHWSTPAIERLMADMSYVNGIRSFARNEQTSPVTNVLASENAAAKRSGRP